MSPPNPSPLVAERCSHLGNLLPQRLNSLRPRVISPRSPLVHAWGSPAVVLSCGVPTPVGYSPTSAQTTTVGGVIWFERRGSSVDTWTAIRPGRGGQSVNVAVQVPLSYAGQGAFLVDLAFALRDGIR